MRPVLKAHCFHCHGEREEPKAGLDLRLRRLIVAGGKSGPAISPGSHEQSLLYRRISRGEMPPGDDGQTKLSREEIELIARWIDAGAKTLRPEPEQFGGGMLITEEDRRHWSFQPLSRPPVPSLTGEGAAAVTPSTGGAPVRDGGPQIAARPPGSLSGESDARNPVDAFILARLRKESLNPARPADKRTLIRRATFDLLGLPPTTDEIDEFLADDSPDAFERLLERLLASPHYGERWGRHWLDVAGYADSEGYTSEDPERKWAWKYRDYVIRSFNSDKPFDQFIREQLAGDEMVSPPFKNLAPAEAEKLVATGFLRTAPDGTAGSGGEAGVARNQVIADTIEVVSTSLLGLTVGCARCHHHRYDPIPQEDYYRLRAIFEPAYDWKNWRRPQQRLVSLYTDADCREAARIEAEAKKIDEEHRSRQDEYIERTFEKELAKLPEGVREKVRAAHETPAKKRTPDQKALLKKYPSVNVTAGSLYLYDRKAADELKKIAARASKLRATKPAEEFVRALTETPGRVPQTVLFDRGDHRQPKQELAPGGLTVLASTRRGSLASIPDNDPDLPTTGRRLAWARRLTDGGHPLTARVLVNRFWMHHFGRGIVATPGDFGALGEEPSHPELLDWLATEFARGSVGRRPSAVDRGVRGQESGVSQRATDNGQQTNRQTTHHSPLTTHRNRAAWSVKRLHRLMMSSAVYRRSGRREPRAREIDPDNRLLAGMPLRRLEAEAVRDAILAVSGRLNRKPFGPPVPVMADRVGQFVIGIENLNAGRPGPVIPMNGEEFRRSVYVQVRRSRPLAVLETFDMPAMSPNCTSRPESTVALQSLLMMNNEFVVEHGESFARRVIREAGDDRNEQVKRAWRIAFGREPSEGEVHDSLAFLADQAKLLSARGHSSPGRKTKKGEPGDPPDAGFRALASFCQTLLGSNEFLHVD